MPDERHHETVNRSIYDELVHGKCSTPAAPPSSALIDELWDAGAQGVILGCTELELLVKQADAEIPVFPCTTLHVEAGARPRAGVAGRLDGPPRSPGARAASRDAPARRPGRSYVRGLVVQARSPGGIHRPCRTADHGSPRPGRPQGRADRDHQVGLPPASHRRARPRRGTAPARRTPSRTSPARRTAGTAGRGPGGRRGRAPHVSGAREPAPSGAPCRGSGGRCTSPRGRCRSSTTVAEPASWCRPSMFWVTTPGRPAGPRRRGRGWAPGSRELAPHLPRRSRTSADSTYRPNVKSAGS